jgi:DNA repair exonuclease SbcCD ATPase subunit
MAIALLAAAWFLFLPRRQLTTAAARETAVLAKVGMPSYLTYQMRRVEAVVDPEARQRLDVAAVEHRAAVGAWQHVAGGVPVETATRLAEEIRSYARALSSLGDTADEIEHARRDLTERAEPAVEAARAAVLEAIEPFGLDDASSAIETVHERVTVAVLARLQAELEDAEAEEATLADGLGDLLDQVGIVDAPLDERVEALDWAVKRAEERQAARTRGRSREAIEDDLMRLQAEARRLRRPEWASVTPSDAAPPELGELRRRRDQLKAELERSKAMESEVERLTDRTGALERRVAALESQHGGGGDAPLATVIGDVHRELLAHLTDANHHATDAERVPVVLDDPFVRIPAERKWELLDMLLRLADRVQVVYLTDDPYVTAWGRRRAGDGTILLLEPEREPA